MNSNQKETTLLAINFNDRLDRHLILILNNDQKCVTAMWIESDKMAINQSDKLISNTELYKALQEVK